MRSHRVMMEEEASGKGGEAPRLKKAGLLAEALRGGQLPGRGGC